MAYEKTLKLVTNLDRGAVEAKIAEIRDSARSSQLAELASLLTGVEGLPRAQMEARVAIAESDRFGGTCVNVGCIPKKLLSYAAHFREDFEVAAAYGWNAGAPSFDWLKLLANKDREIERLNAVYERALTGAGVEIIRG